MTEFGRQENRRAEVDYIIPKTPQERARNAELAFQEISHGAFRGELDRPNDDGTSTRIAAYEVFVDPMDQHDVRAWVTEFGLRAAAAGYKQAIGPVVLPIVGFRDPEVTRPLTGIHFFLEQPAKAPQLTVPADAIQPPHT